MTSERICLDVMGGDDAPGATLDGVVQALAPEGSLKLDPARLLLVGDAERIRAGLAERGCTAEFEIRHATQVVGMGESAATALRKKPDSSIASCVGAIREGLAGALVSMGNTGACVGSATLGLKTLAGVKRPGIAVTLELTGKPLTLLDMGANVAPKPEHLHQYAVMGSIYSRQCLDVAEPRVALLNVGEEPEKGTDVLKETHKQLQGSGLNFVGNVEGGDLFSGCADVVVTDGFTGNVVLKLMENFAGFIFQLMMGELKAHNAVWGDAAVGAIRRQIDYSEYGGALLLGVNGVVVIGHGRSDGRAVANALALAARTLDARVNADIVAGLGALA